jgi:hypothetical protein
MSTKKFGQALEPRNWFDLDKQMAGWTGTSVKEETETATNNMKAQADAERARAEKEAADAAEAAEKERREGLKKRKGLAGTILTSGLGITEEAATKFKTLLGG